MKRISIFILFCMATFGETIAQDTLRLEDAIKLALENNYGIQVARNQAKIAENSAQPGMAGLYPKVDLIGGVNYSNQGSSVTFADGREQEASMIATDNNNLSVDMTYTIFDGFANIYNYRILKTNSLLSKEQTRSNIDQTMAQVMNAYFQVARLANNFDILEKSANVSIDRVDRIAAQREYGLSTRLAALNATVDLNTDSVNLATARLGVENAKRDLRVLLGDEMNTDFEVSREINLLSGVDLDKLIDQAIDNNPAVVIANYNRKVSELDLRVAKAARMPRVDINASYGQNNRNNGPLSFATKTSSLGFTGGASLSLNLFDGFRKKISIENAQIGMFNSELQYEEAQKQLQHDLGNAVASYQNSLDILRLEERSLEAAQLNFDQTVESFKLGQATGLQFREAQLNLIRSQNQLNELRFDVKVSETELLRLSGTLVK